MKMDIEKLICGLNSIDINHDGRPDFVLDNSIQADDLYFVTRVQLNFYQIWSIFNTLPIVTTSGKCKYEWRFVSKNKKHIFTICDWNNDKSFLKTKTWHILSNTLDDDIVGLFIKTLCDALECYNKFYKISIEARDFTSENSVVHTCLQNIKISLIQNKDVLKNI